MMYDSEDDLLPLSGIQHFAFCERQWGLIHIENQWAENMRTTEGKLLHQRVDDPYFTETRGDVKVIRSIQLASKTLGFYGVADAIELQKGPNSSGFSYNMVEYKRGKPKPDGRDEVQLCAQAICLEEMLSIELDHGYLFYGETKHRLRVDFNATLRAKVRLLAERMHELFAKGETPRPIKSAHCKNCSLYDICIPKLADCTKKTEQYLNSILADMENG